MKKLIFIDDTRTNKISYWLLAAFLVTLPFDRFYSEIILFCFALHTLFHCKKSYLKALFCKEFAILISVYMIGIITILYSSEKAEGFNIATKQLAVLIFPVLFVLNQIDLNKYYLQLFKFFVLIVTIATSYLYFDALHTIAYFHLPLSSLFNPAFMNHNFAMPIEMHATYLSLYVAFSIVTLIYLLTKQNGISSKLLYIGAIIILSAGLLQLASRAVIIAVLIIINVALPVLLLQKKRLQFCAISFTLSVTLLLGITQIASFRTRYISELKKDLSDKILLVEVDESRATRWEAITELIKASPIIGYGAGAQQQLLQDKYFEKKLFVSYLNHLDTHNEYLDLLLEAGFAGLILLICVLAQGFYIAFRQHDFLFAGFLLLISIVFVSENVLESNKGIFFYSFLFSLFLLKDKFRHKQLQEQPLQRGNYKF